jgi:hypothetical protein
VTLAAACVWAAAGCAGDGPPPANTDSSFDSIQRTIFDVNCLSAGCHNSADRAADLVLEVGESYANLVNVVPDNPAASDAGLRRVAPGLPESSFLLIKLTGPDAEQGSRMPRGGPPLAANDIDRLRAWIAAGAPPPVNRAASPTPSPTGTESPTATPTATALATPSAF